MSEVLIESIELAYQSGSSDKVYNVQLIEDKGSYRVDFQYGRRGSTLALGCKIDGADKAAAKKVYDKLVAEKTGKGYQVSAQSSPSPSGGRQGKAVATGTSFGGAAIPNTQLFVPHLLLPVDEQMVMRYLDNDSYGIQEKKDGKHVTLEQTNGTITVRNKLGKAIPFPSTLSLIEGLHIDCEQIGDTYHIFDVMRYGNKNTTQLGYLIRHDLINKFIDDLNELGNPVGISFKRVDLIKGTAAKVAFYEHIKETGKEGVVFKKLDAPYECGARHGAMMKYKFTATCTALVTGSRTAGKRSVGLQLLEPEHWDNSQKIPEHWVDIGNVTIPPNHTIPLVGSLVEIRYLYAYKGGSLFQPVYLGIRDDVSLGDCVMAQLKYKAEEDIVDIPREKKPTKKEPAKSLFTQNVKVTKVTVL